MFGLENEYECIYDKQIAAKMFLKLSWPLKNIPKFFQVNIETKLVFSFECFKSTFQKNFKKLELKWTKDFLYYYGDCLWGFSKSACRIISKLSFFY